MLRTSGDLSDWTLVRTTSLMLSQDWTSRLTLMSLFFAWNPEMIFCQFALVASLYEGTSRSRVVAPPCDAPPPEEDPLPPNPHPARARAETVTTTASRAVRTRILQCWCLPPMDAIRTGPGFRGARSITGRDRGPRDFGPSRAPVDAAPYLHRVEAGRRRTAPGWRTGPFVAGCSRSLHTAAHERSRARRPPGGRGRDPAGRLADGGRLGRRTPRGASTAGRARGRHRVRDLAVRVPVLRLPPRGSGGWGHRRLGGQRGAAGPRVRPPAGDHPVRDDHRGAGPARVGARTAAHHGGAGRSLDAGRFAGRLGDRAALGRRAVGGADAVRHDD